MAALLMAVATGLGLGVAGQRAQGAYTSEGQPSYSIVNVQSTSGTISLTVAGETVRSSASSVDRALTDYAREKKLDSLRYTPLEADPFLSLNPTHPSSEATENPSGMPRSMSR